MRILLNLFSCKSDTMAEIWQEQRQRLNSLHLTLVIVVVRLVSVFAYVSLETGSRGCRTDNLPQCWGLALFFFLTSLFTFRVSLSPNFFEIIVSLFVKLLCIAIPGQQLPLVDWNVVDLDGRLPCTLLGLSLSPYMVSAGWEFWIKYLSW